MQHLPNIISLTRIGLAPVVAFLVFVPGFMARLGAFLFFLVAALSDVWDGYLARRHGWVTNLGKLLDPLADKLLLVATVIPIYYISHNPDHLAVGSLPYWGTLPLWVLLVFLLREGLITGLRGYAARRGVVLPAGKAGKWKTAFQNVFIGATLLWYAFETAVWGDSIWELLRWLHGIILAFSLLAAVVLTVYSLGVYLWQWRRLRA